MRKNKLKTSILIVDDDLDIRKLLTYLCENLCDHIFEAESGEDAIKIIREENIQLVLSDIKMKEVSGVDLLKQIKEVDPLIPVILISGYADVKVSRLAMRCGAYDIIDKPFIEETVIKRVNDALVSLKKEKMESELVTVLCEIFSYKTNLDYVALNDNQRFECLSAVSTILMFKKDKIKHLLTIA